MEPVSIVIAVSVGATGCIFAHWATTITKENTQLREVLTQPQSVSEPQTEEDKLKAALPDKMHDGKVVGAICTCTNHKRFLVADNKACYSYASIKDIELDFRG